MGTAEVESALVAHHDVAEAAVVGCPHEIKGQGSYAYVPYRNASVVPDPGDVPNDGTPYSLSNTARRDNVGQVDAILERPLTEWLVASARDTYIDNDSNTDVYDYDRHIVGGYLTVQWGR